MFFRVQPNHRVEQATAARTYHLWIVIVLLLTSAVFIFALLASEQTNIWFIKEGGLIETMSAGAYLFCAALMLKLGDRIYLKNNWYFLIVLIAFAMRELDFDKRFTEVGILKSKFLISPEVSLTAKITGFLIVAFVAFAMIRMIRQHGGAIVKRIKTGQLSSVDWSLLIATGFIFISKTIDGIGRKLADIGIVISEQADTIFAHFEESLEWAIPLLCIVAVLAYFKEQAGSATSLQPNH